MSDSSDTPGADDEIDVIEVVTEADDDEGNVVIDDMVAIVDGDGNVLATDETIAIATADGDVVVDETISVRGDDGERHAIEEDVTVLEPGDES